MEGLFNEKYFTSQSIAKSRSGIIDQIIIHLLKIKYGFDEDRDRDKHISDVTSWIWDLRREILSDKSRASIEFVILNYRTKERVLPKLAIKITREFKKNYNFSGNVTLYDLEEMLAHLSLCITDCSRRSDIMDYINRSFKSEKEVSYSEVMRRRRLFDE